MSADETDLEALRNAFVEYFNARDAESVLDLVADDVETPDLAGEGADALRDELERIWLGAPGVVLTRAEVDGSPAALAWIPDEEGLWTRSRLFTFDAEDELLTVVEMPEDADDLDRVVAEDPMDEPPDEEVTWPEWDRSEDVRDIGHPMHIEVLDEGQLPEDAP